MLTIVEVLEVLAGLASLGCFMVVVVKMFHKGQTGLGVTCSVPVACGVGCLIAFLFDPSQPGELGFGRLGFICISVPFFGVGCLIAFLWGWGKSGEWNIRYVMVAWTGCILLVILLAVFGSIYSNS